MDFMGNQSERLLPLRQTSEEGEIRLALTQPSLESGKTTPAEGNVTFVSTDLYLLALGFHLAP